ncbi:DNA-directed RNA polymerase subunit D [Candidatus Woesearchaeota archaeon]|nr:DNA-directed RNA polymerase subunit D [Candidatus Woesearchaeota archaeon]
MKIELINKNKDESQASFLVKGVTPAFVNTLRRLILEQVPTLAIEDVVFRKNGSILYDEILAHRLGLVPLVTDLKSYVTQDKCECKGEGCAQCSLKITLEKQGPCVVYSGDLKFADPAIKPVFDNIPIVKLLEGQDLSLEATAILGRGKDHTKWAPGYAHFRNVPEVKVVGDVVDPERIASLCHGLFSVKAGKLEVNQDKLLDYNLAYLDDELGNSVRINLKEDEFIFTIETWKQLSIKDILTESFNCLDSSMDEFAAKIKEL